jgi:hypothetical protein
MPLEDIEGVLQGAKLLLLDRTDMPLRDLFAFHRVVT